MRPFLIEKHDIKILNVSAVNREIQELRKMEAKMTEMAEEVSENCKREKIILIFDI